MQSGRGKENIVSWRSGEKEFREIAHSMQSIENMGQRFIELGTRFSNISIIW
jgi:hypothetical protein